MSSHPFGFREVHALVLEALRSRTSGQYAELAEDVLRLAVARGLVPQPAQGDGVSAFGRPAAHLPQAESARICRLVEEAMWDCMSKGLLIFALDESNSRWPFYRLTSRGAEVVREASPQPYDPDGFLKHLARTVPALDADVRGYIEEAVRAYVSGCPRSAAVMLGCASEKMVLLLCEALEASISDPKKKAEFLAQLAKKWMISHKYAALSDRLELMEGAGRFPREHGESVKTYLPIGYDLIRQCRNAAGHPNVPGDIEPDTVFLNLRMFTEYARRATGLIEHLGTNPADW